MKFRYSILFPFSVLLFTLLSGCQSYEIVQSNVFSDDNGNAAQIDYGRSDKVHENSFVNPATGKEMTYRSNLVIDVRLPDGSVFTAWQCMNFTGNGTMYRTDNEKWMVLVTGFSCVIYLNVGNDYREVFRGILCDSPKVDYKPNPKWRELKKDANGRWR